MKQKESDDRLNGDLDLQTTSEIGKTSKGKEKAKDAMIEDQVSLRAACKQISF